MAKCFWVFCFCLGFLGVWRFFGKFRRCVLRCFCLAFASLRNLQNASFQLQKHESSAREHLFFLRPTKAFANAKLRFFHLVTSSGLSAFCSTPPKLQGRLHGLRSGFSSMVLLIQYHQMLSLCNYMKLTFWCSIRAFPSLKGFRV